MTAARLTKAEKLITFHRAADFLPFYGPDTRLSMSDENAQKQAPSSPAPSGRLARLLREPEYPLAPWARRVSVQPKEKPPEPPPPEPAKPSPLHPELGPNDLRLVVTATLENRDGVLAKSTRSTEVHDSINERGRVLLLTALGRLQEETRCDVPTLNESCLSGCLPKEIVTATCSVP